MKTEFRILYIPGLYERKELNFAKIKHEFRNYPVKIEFIDWYCDLKPTLMDMVLHANSKLENIDCNKDVIISHSFGFWVIQKHLNKTGNNAVHIAYDPSLPLKKMLSLELINYLKINNYSFKEFCSLNQNLICNYIISGTFGGYKIGNKISRKIRCNYVQLPLHHNLIKRDEGKLFVDEVKKYLAQK